MRFKCEGCLGAIRLSEKLLNSYWILLLLLLAGDILMGLVWIFRFQKIVTALMPDLRQRIAADYGQSDPEFRQAWDWLQQSARCCGVESPADFNNSTWLRNLGVNTSPAWQPSKSEHIRSRTGAMRLHALPDSCCKSASASSDQSFGTVLNLAVNQVPPGRKEVYGTGKHRQQLRDYNERFHERMREHAAAIAAAAAAAAASSSTSTTQRPLNRANRSSVSVRHGTRYPRAAATTTPPLPYW